MHLEPTHLAGAWVVSPTVYHDHRGSFMETYRTEWFEAMGLSFSVCQSNQSVSKKGVLRGLHYQRAPHGQGKLVQVLKGKIWDVGVDIDPGSPTYGQWVGVTLCDQSHRMLWLSPAMAHGFLVLSDHAVVSYQCSGSVYHPESEAGICWNDETLGIEWPIDGSVVVSDKDRALPPFGLVTP